jgi:hypothetical protein
LRLFIVHMWIHLQRFRPGKRLLFLLIFCEKFVSFHIDPNKISPISIFGIEFRDMDSWWIRFLKLLFLFVNNFMSNSQLTDMWIDFTTLYTGAKNVVLRYHVLRGNSIRKVDICAVSWWSAVPRFRHQYIIWISQYPNSKGEWILNDYTPIRYWTVFVPIIFIQSFKKDSLKLRVARFEDSMKIFSNHFFYFDEKLFDAFS